MLSSACSMHQSCVCLSPCCSQARVGGMLSGKCGLVYCHMGAAKEGLQPLIDAVSCSDVPITQFLPTHVERTPELTDAGAKWVQAGGYVNLTCQEHTVHLDSVVCQLLHGQLEHCCQHKGRSAAQT